MPTPQSDHRPNPMRKKDSTRGFRGHFDTCLPTPSQRLQELGAKRPTRCIETMTIGKLIVVRFQRVVDEHQTIKTQQSTAETKQKSIHRRQMKNRQFRPTRVATFVYFECCRPSRYLNLYISEKLTIFSSCWCWCHYLRMNTDQHSRKREILLEGFGVTLTHIFQLQVKECKSGARSAPLGASRL